MPAIILPPATSILTLPGQAPGPQVPSGMTVNASGIWVPGTKLTAPTPGGLVVIDKPLSISEMHDQATAAYQDAVAKYGVAGADAMLGSQLHNADSAYAALKSEEILKLFMQGQAGAAAQILAKP